MMQSIEPDDVQVLQWLPDQDRWQPISWQQWQAFRSGHGLPSIAAGIHHFIVAIHDDDGQPVNLIPHKYLIEPSGRISRDNFSGLNRREREDYQRLMLARTMTPDDQARLDAIRQKRWPAMLPPPQAMAALRRALAKPAQPNSLADHFLQQHDSTESAQPE